MKKLFAVYVCGEWERNTGIKGIEKVIDNWGDFTYQRKTHALRQVREGQRVSIDNLISINKGG